MAYLKVINHFNLLSILKLQLAPQAEIPIVILY
jgi:hypothetical protein